MTRRQGRNTESLGSGYESGHGVLLEAKSLVLTSSHFVCPGICCCSAETIRCTEATERSLPGDQKDVFKRLTLTHLSLSSVASHSFDGLSGVLRIEIAQSDTLKTIEAMAFNNLPNLSEIDVSLTALEALPSRGLQSLRLLVARGTYSLKSLPPLGALESLQEAQLTYPSHCCALFDWNARSIPGLAADSTAVPPLKDPAMSEEYREALDPVDFYYPDFDFCRSPRMLRCTPEADAFNPCEDIAGFQFLRVAIWFINVLAITGNLMVLLVLVASRGKLTVPRFLMCHLAFADLCIGIYLLMIAIVDGRTRGSYSQHAIAWQTGPGCAAAGFLSVFGSELSPERRLGLSRALLTMAGGWFLCLGVALLPLVGVSSYRKVSVCLPMDIETPLAQAFVILLLFLNVAAFLIVCACYARIYQAVWNPEFAGRNADAKIAKRMAVLIFTDFLCMAPISFFAISAAFKVPLITVTNSKILLVLFYPINSCANPFLYAICTKAFRRDVFALASTLPCCESKASVYRTKAYCLDNSADKPSSVAAAKKSSRIALRMAAFSSSIPAE
ncbi:Lutropin-choriogonadotropic hormone receptor-like [Scleropages formosus]|uniref:Lutropin-choriogonadotropic hormone receptor-like n=1 Tax=Scleropages formosus TaxID=113540 RepID=A0A0P7XE47_SCLFO|nr:Lutropin-choriogonadotropic hormone receptor-like [Scleropages formosus]